MACILPNSIIPEIRNYRGGYSITLDHFRIKRDNQIMSKLSDCETYVYHVLKQPDKKCVSRSEAMKLYKEGWTDEPGKYPPGLRGIWYKIVLYFRRKKSAFNTFWINNREKVYVGVVIGVLSGTFLVFTTYLVNRFILNHPNKESSQQPEQLQSQQTNTTKKHPEKAPSRAIPLKKSQKTISQSTISALNSNIFIGSNTGTVNQTINNPEPKPVPLINRLISCLDNIDKKIIPALRAGNTSFEGKVLPYQLAELQKLSAESGASNYITLTVKPGFILTKKKGTVYSVKFILSPTLLDN